MSEDENIRYLSDEDIESRYKDFIIREFSCNKSSGYIEILFPHYEDKIDNFMVYDDGKIAFDYWYPSEIADKLILYIADNFEHKEIKDLIQEQYSHLIEE